LEYGLEVNLSLRKFTTGARKGSSLAVVQKQIEMIEEFRR